MHDIYEVAKYQPLVDYISRKTIDYWKNTYFEGYKALNNTQKGAYGEELISRYLQMIYGCSVTGRTNAGHDRTVDGYKAEYKFSLCSGDPIKKPNIFVINHVSMCKDWDRLIFVGINHPDTNLDPLIFFIEKQEFIDFNKTENFKTFFSCQQAGVSGTNDDFICSGNKPLRLFQETTLAKNLSEWK